MMLSPLQRQMIKDRMLEQKTKILDSIFTPKGALIVSAVYYIPFAIAHIVQIPFAIADVFAMNSPHFGGVFGAFLLAHVVANLLVAGAANEHFKWAFLILEAILETFILLISRQLLRRAGNSVDSVESWLFFYIPWLVYVNTLLSIARPPYKNWRETRESDLWRQVKDDAAKRTVYEGSKKKSAIRSGGRHSTPVPRRYKYTKVHIDGQEFDKGLLDLVEALVARRGGESISIEDTEYIIMQIRPSYNSHYRHIEKRTIQYIRHKYDWSEASDEHFRSEIRKWAAEKAAITKRTGSFHND
eukprot:GEMP01046706.1.p1 GENE.GEMP01046706.1~~GEMP01046706.1.p1  ORF type:complete len:300 (+),score=70.66 GEMP01046706.1:91-990(+)